MKHATTKTLYQYWDKLRGGRPSPERSDIDPADIREILADTFILEILDKNTFQFRLAGTRMCGSFCKELKGQNFLDFWKNEDLSSVQMLLAAVSEDEAAAVIGFEGKTERGQTLKFETLLLPMRHYGKRKRRILGALAPMDMPYWVGIWPIVEMNITSIRLVWPDEQPSFMKPLVKTSVSSFGAVPEQTKQSGNKPIPASFKDTSSNKRFGHLVVIEGGKT
ncbi:MAG: PAS domain-containing protein [Hyphomicrobiales bacterium]|nr:MAG: PAS domain-containing protein [Hyphomicrobiales bacterium]